jgi:alpha-N-arabinofuranosidase
VNVIAPIYTKDGDLMKQTIWWPYLLTAQHMRGRAIATLVNCSTWNGELTGQLNKFAGMLPELKNLDVASTIDDKNVLTVSIVNGKLEDVEADLQIDCEIKEGIEKIEVYGEPGDENSFEKKDNVIPVRSQLSSSKTVVLKRCSYTMLRYQL